MNERLIKIIFSPGICRNFENLFLRFEIFEIKEESRRTSGSQKFDPET